MRWRRCRASGGPVSSLGGSAGVVITGEPGEGKTRIGSELAALVHAALARPSSTGVVMTTPSFPTNRSRKRCGGTSPHASPPCSATRLPTVPSSSAWCRRSRRGCLSSPPGDADRESSRADQRRRRLHHASNGRQSDAARPRRLAGRVPRTLELVGRARDRAAAGLMLLRCRAVTTTSATWRRWTASCSRACRSKVSRPCPRAPGRASRTRRGRRRCGRVHRRQRDRWQPGARPRGGRPPAVRRRAERGSRRAAGRRRSRRLRRPVPTRACWRSSPRTPRSSSGATRTLLPS